MKTHQKIAIAIDNTKIDQILYQVCLKLKGLLFNLKEIHILYARNLDILQKQQIKESIEFMELDAVHEVALKNAISSKAMALFGKENKDKVHIHILNGSPIEEAIRFNATEAVDLFIVGKKTSKKRSGRFAKELIRRTETPILIVPEKVNLKRSLWDILVPYDFSKLSDKALLTGMNIHPFKEGYKIECFHIIDSPILTPDMIASTHHLYKIMEEGRKEIFDKKVNELKLEQIPTLKIHDGYHNNVSKEIASRGREGKFGLIIMGAKGHSALERLFIGSVTEKTISKNNRIPLLIVK